MLVDPFASSFLLWPNIYKIFCLSHLKIYSSLVLPTFLCSPLYHLSPKLSSQIEASCFLSTYLLPPTLNNGPSTVCLYAFVILHTSYKENLTRFVFWYVANLVSVSLRSPDNFYSNHFFEYRLYAILQSCGVDLNNSQYLGGVLHNCF